MAANYTLASFSKTMHYFGENVNLSVLPAAVDRKGKIKLLDEKDASVAENKGVYKIDFKYYSPSFTDPVIFNSEIELERDMPQLYYNDGITDAEKKQLKKLQSKKQQPKEQERNLRKNME